MPALPMNKEQIIETDKLRSHYDRLLACAGTPASRDGRNNIPELAAAAEKGDAEASSNSVASTARRGCEKRIAGKPSNS